MPQKFKYCPHCQAPLEDDGSCPGCAYGHKRTGSASGKRPSPECPFDDHGRRCNLIGSISDSTTGSGPWYCPEHYWQLKGYPMRKAERRLTPEESDAKILQEVKDWCAAHKLYSRDQQMAYVRSILKEGSLAKKLMTMPRQREPGEDDD